MARIKVRRTHREELPGVAVLRDAVAAELPAYGGQRRVLDLDMEVDPDLRHLMAHDPDGFFTALEKEETLGFGAAHVRSRQCVVSELWVLPQHRGKGAGEALLSRVLAYGERSGAREFLALVPVEGPVQALLLRHQLTPLCPVYRFRLDADQAHRLGGALSRLLPGQDITGELVQRRGHAHLDRIDRLTRGVIREVDHTYWLKGRGLRAAFIRHGARIGAYAYGGTNQVGPAAGTSREAALCAVGWAVDLAASSGRATELRVQVPAPFAAAVEAFNDTGAHLEATFMLYGRGVSLSFDRALMGNPTLP